MASGYEIIRYRPEFKQEVVELQRFLWSSDVAVNTAYFEWKYERAPYLSEPLVHLALHGGRVVGMRGLHGSKWQAGHPSETFSALCADDLVVHPEHRNRGVSTSVIRAASEDLGDRDHQWVFSSSAGPVTVVSSLAMGWRRVGAMQPMERGPSLHWRLVDRLSALVGRSNLLRQAARRMWRASTAVVGHPFVQLERNAAHRRREASLHVTVSQEPRPGAMADLVERLAWDGRIRHVRDREYLNWRFRNPLFRYCFLFWEDTRLQGYLVLRAPVYWLAPVAIVDWEGSSRQVLNELLDTAINCGSFGKLTAWSATGPDERRPLLCNHGFRDEVRRGVARYHPCVLVRPMPEKQAAKDWTVGGRTLLDPANWDMRMLYSMYG
jgi:GNAT superfamily N-acetyltransferase